VTDKVEMNSEKGKETIDALLAKMTPEQQEQFKASLNGNKPVHVHVGKDGKISLGDEAFEAAQDAGDTQSPPPEVVAAMPDPAPESPVELKKDEPKKLSKIDQKRQQIFFDRLKRHMGKGLTQEQAIQAMQQEDYNAMPLEKKFQGLERLVSQSLRNLSNDIMIMSQNHMAISDAFDINYRAIQKAFIKLGLSNEEQGVLIAEAQKEVIEARKKEMEARDNARSAAQQAQREAVEKAAVEAELASKGKVQEPAPEGSEIPKEATVFGG
jgi:hypothetical protein